MCGPFSQFTEGIRTSYISSRMTKSSCRYQMIYVSVKRRISKIAASGTPSAYVIVHNQ